MFQIQKLSNAKNGEIEFYSSGDSAVEENDAVKLCELLWIIILTKKVA